MIKHTFFVLSSLLLLINAAPVCRFAPFFSQEDILGNLSVRDKFIQTILYWEGNFHADQVGINAKTGLTYDGHAIDYKSGELVEPLHYWSASSKESIHLGMLSKALIDDNVLEFFHVPSKYAKQKVGQDTRLTTVLDILERKITSYENYNKQFPGFGGFIPWVYVNDSGMIPIPKEWDHQVPGLDNGEMIWGIYAVIQALEKTGYHELSQRYQKYFDLLAKNVQMVFYDGNGYIRAVTKIKDPKAQPTPSNYELSSGYLDDPYEGELLAVFMDLFGIWTNQTEREQIWINKRPLLQRVDLTTPLGPITTQKGWWFSSHEQWKYLMLPYLDVPINKRVFINGEKARTWFSLINGYPGLFASVTNVTTPGVYPNYLSATGIQQIAFQQVQTNDVLTPYGAFPVIIADKPYGLVWYHNMISGPRMQNKYGSTESVNNEGTEICPVITWDSKITTVLAMIDGVVELNREGLSKAGKLQRFYDVINREWTRVFSDDLKGEGLPFQLPTKKIPTDFLNNFSSCVE